MAYTEPKTWAFQEGVESAELNIEIRDNFRAMGPHLIARKTSDQSVTSSTVLVNDAALFLPMLANEVWQFKFLVTYGAGTGGHMGMAFTFPTGGDLRLGIIALDTAGIASNKMFSTTTSPTATRDFQGLGATSFVTVPMEGVFVNGANAGNLQLQWAQWISNGTSTTVKTHSTVWGVKLA